MVEVFKTDITCRETAENILRHLQQLFPTAEVNFDLEDCDKILRVKNQYDISHLVIDLVNEKGHLCEILL
jgi:hypothetical protein